MTRAEKTANSFTCLGIEGIVRANERKLEELDRLDAELGDHCREARDASRIIIQSKLKDTREALRIRKANGGS